jgi:hypothetical protein
VVTKNWLKGTVSRQQPGVPIALLEGFYGRLFLNQGGNNVSVVRRLLLSNDNPVAIANSGINHRLSDDLQEK